MRMPVSGGERREAVVSRGGSGKDVREAVARREAEGGRMREGERGG
jgi:hypothetical protein